MAIYANLIQRAEDTRKKRTVKPPEWERRKIYLNITAKMSSGILMFLITQRGSAHVYETYSWQLKKMNLIHVYKVTTGLKVFGNNEEYNKVSLRDYTF